MDPRPPITPTRWFLITEKTPTLGDTPVDVKFFGYTIEVGTKGLFIGNGANNIHYDNGYIENVSTPYSVTGAVSNTFNGNHIANWGTSRRSSSSPTTLVDLFATLSYTEA